MMISYHTKSIEESFDLLNSSKMGLTTQEAKIRKEHHGSNVLPEGKQRSVFLLLLDQFKSPIIYILLIAALISFIIGEFTDGYFIMAVLGINAVIGFFQEYTAGQKANALKKAVKTYCYVLRDGVKHEVDSEEITLSDIILLESGSKVPADIRLIETNDLKVNESLLTGESMSVQKDPLFLSDDPELPVGDRKNMLYAGSYIESGRGMGIVCAIGKETEVGKIATLLADSGNIKPPLIVRMEQFSINIAKIIGVVVMFLFALGLYQGMAVEEIFFVAVALAVSSIPEGLPVAITVSLSVASSVMSKKNVIVRKLASIEGLGSCTFIASDKTGTLTQNKLAVEQIIMPEHEASESEELKKHIHDCAFYCNEATIAEEEGAYAYLGDQVDIALAKYALDANSNYFEEKERAHLVNEVPYESYNRYSAAVYEREGLYYHYIKGSPEEILSFSNQKADEKASVIMQVDEWANDGFRNIALAYKVSSSKEITLSGFSYLGFAAIIDPLREGVKEAVQKAQDAGIEVAMITGDHPNTAYFIAKELGIAVDKEEVIDGKEILLWMERGAPKEEIENKRVFARVSPEQKQQIVIALQSLGHFVAVTGDGVNDAPALKYSNIGISMGKSGTDVARDASDLILTDDSFSSIVNGIEEGRVAYDNIRKVIHLLISTGFAEIILVVLAMIFTLPIALLPVQLLWLNLVTNGIQDVALGFESGEKGVLRRRPRSPKESIFNTVMVRRVVIGGLYMGLVSFGIFWWLLQTGYSEDSARNIVLLMLVLFENVHVFNSRSEFQSIFSIQYKKSLGLIMIVIMTQLIHIGALYMPFMQHVLHVEPVSLDIWLLLSGIALVLVIVMELEKKVLVKQR